MAQATRDLAVLVRARTSLVEARTAASNQLWAVLAEHWPGAGAVFQKLISQIALAFLADYPTPQAAALLGEGRMGQFCRRHAYRGGKSARRAPRPAARGAQQRPTRSRRCAGRVVAGVRRPDPAPQRRDRAARARRRRARSPLTPRPRCSRLPRVANVSLAQLDRRDRPAAGTLRQPRTGSRHVRRRARDACVGQDPHRRFPLRRQQARPGRHHRLRRQLPALLGLGSRALPASPNPRCSPPPRRADRGPRLDPCHLGVLAHRHRLRPVTTPRRTARSNGLDQENSSDPWSCGSRRRRGERGIVCRRPEDRARCSPRVDLPGVGAQRVVVLQVAGSAPDTASGAAAGLDATVRRRSRSPTATTGRRGCVADLVEWGWKCRRRRWRRRWPVRVWWAGQRNAGSVP